MANEQNLIRNEDLTPTERRERARKAGIASGRARAERKTLREELLLLLEEDKMQEKISLALLDQARKGNTKAYEIIRDTIGEKPKDIIDANVNTDIKVTLDD